MKRPESYDGTHEEGAASSGPDLLSSHIRKEIEDRLLRKEIENLRREDGRVYPEDVVAFARKHPDSAAHARFNWNLEEAAMQHWLDRARHLIRVYVTVLPEEPRQMIRAYVNIVGEEGYRDTATVLADPDTRRDFLRGQVERLWSIYSSYPLKELKPIGDAIEKVRNKLG
jgi:hypothetical protein